jgi:hypothetical protein
MAEEFENALKSLKLEDNAVTGVAALQPWGRISEIFKDLKEKHLHIVVERLPREFEWLVAAAANLTISSTDSRAAYELR